jgi:hypothetical protein
LWLFHTCLQCFLSKLTFSIIFPFSVFLFSSFLNSIWWVSLCCLYMYIWNVLHFEVKFCEVSSFILFAQDCFGHYGFLVISCKFCNIFLVLCRTPLEFWWELYWNYRTLNCINILPVLIFINHEHGNIIPFLVSSIISFIRVV